MKEFTIILFFCLFSVISLDAGVEPKLDNEENTTYVVTMENDIEDIKTIYTEKDDHLEFNTDQIVMMIQIFNTDGKMEFQLPVQSDQIKLGKSLFDKGEYTLGFILSNQNSLKFTTIKVL